VEPVKIDTAPSCDYSGNIVDGRTPVSALLERLSVEQHAGISIDLVPQFTDPDVLELPDDPRDAGQFFTVEVILVLFGVEV
jgi:hypothetical protein